MRATDQAQAMMQKQQAFLRAGSSHGGTWYRAISRQAVPGLQQNDGMSQQHASVLSSGNQGLATTAQTVACRDTTTAQAAGAQAAEDTRAGLHAQVGVNHSSPSDQAVPAQEPETSSSAIDPALLAPDNPVTPSSVPEGKGKQRVDWKTRAKEQASKVAKTSTPCQGDTQASGSTSSDIAALAPAGAADLSSPHNQKLSMQTSRGSSEAGEPVTSTPDRAKNSSSPQHQHSEGSYDAVDPETLLPDSVANHSSHDNLLLLTDGEPEYDFYYFEVDLESKKEASSRTARN
jgi:hypothetical protein